MSDCCRACAEAGRTKPGKQAIYHADEAVRYAEKARVWAIVSLVLVGVSLTLIIVRAVIWG